VDGLELVVSPKVPNNHFLYLADQAGVLPRIETQLTQIDPAKSLWEVIAHWFVHAAEGVIHGELAKGYSEATDELELSRGRILPLETARLFYQGRPVVACEFEEFSEDIPLNRLLRAGCDLVASSPVLDRSLRHRARVALARMTDVGPLQHSDFRAQVDRLTHRYADAIAFAKVLLRGSGTRIAHGEAHGWCFLIRTPELIEAGIRTVLQRSLHARWPIEKKGRALAGASFTLNPDLVFDRGLAVGDVKYKALDQEWSRADLYQSVAFAAGYECDCAAVIGFKNERSAVPPPVRFGKIGVEAFGWDVGPVSSPEASGDALAAEIAAFLVRAARRRTDLSAA
jgi:5-methylcytosine-specific restriction enzyme subunit McrC